MTGPTASCTGETYRKNNAKPVSEKLTEYQCNKTDAMHDFQKCRAAKSRVCMILTPFQEQKSCIPSDILQKIMHSFTFDAGSLSRDFRPPLIHSIFQKPQKLCKKGAAAAAPFTTHFLFNMPCPSIPGSLRVSRSRHRFRRSGAARRACTWRLPWCLP